MLKKSLLLLCGAVATAFSLFAADEHDPYVANEFIVYVSGGSSAEAHARLEKALAGVKPGAKLTGSGASSVEIDEARYVSPRAHWIRVKPSGTDVYEALRKKYERTPGVTVVKNTKVVSLGMPVTPDDALYAAHQKQLFESFDIPTAWDDFDASATHQDVVVAVPDSGIHFTHPDLTHVYCPQLPAKAPVPPDVLIKAKCKDKGWFHWDALRDPDKKLERLPWDFDGHGTAISGVIAAVHDRFGMAGVAPHNVQILVIRMFSETTGAGTLKDSIAALQYILDLRTLGMPIKVVNCSWRTESTDPVELKPFRDVIEALGPVTLVVCAAGNGGTEVGPTNPVYPAMYAKELTHVISVTSAQLDGLPAASANFGTGYVDIAAPGTEVFTSYTHPAFLEVGGSSIATAFISAAGALLFATNKAVNGSDAKQQLCSAVTRDPEWEKKISCNGAIDFGSLLAP